MTQMLNFVFTVEKTLTRKKTSRGAVVFIEVNTLNNRKCGGVVGNVTSTQRVVKLKNILLPKKKKKTLMKRKMVNPLILDVNVAKNLDISHIIARKILT
jgi:hypothetical protein